MRWGPGVWFAGAFIACATLAICFLVLQPAAAWSSPTSTTAAGTSPGARAQLTLRCDSPWERMTASPSALIRSAVESEFPGDNCAAAIASRQELASGATLLAGVFALFFAATILPRARLRPVRTVRTVRTGAVGRPISWR